MNMMKQERADEILSVGSYADSRYCGDMRSILASIKEDCGCRDPKYALQQAIKCTVERAKAWCEKYQAPLEVQKRLADNIQKYWMGLDEAIQKAIQPDEDTPCVTYNNDDCGGGSYSKID